MKISPFLLALKFLSFKKQFVLGFILIYSLGLSLFLLTENLARFFKTDLKNQAKEILGADLTIETRRDLSPQESLVVNELLGNTSIQAKQWSFFSMVQYQNQVKLLQVKAISENYPLVGNFQIKSNSSPHPSVRYKPLHHGIWVSESFAHQNQLKLGDSLKVGEKFYILENVYTQSPEKSFGIFEMGDAVYIPLNTFPQTNLLQKGSRIFRTHFYLLPKNVPPDELKRDLEKKLSDPEIQINTVKSQSSQLSLIVSRVFSFVSLSTLCAFFLATLGAGYFFYRQVQSQNKQYGMLSMLGFSKQELIKIGVYQNILLSTGAGILSLALCYVWITVASPYLSWSFGIELPIHISWNYFLKGYFLALITSLLFSIGGFRQIILSHPGILIQPMPTGSTGWKFKVFQALLQLGFFYALSIYTTSSYIQSLAFVGLIAGGLLGLCFLGYLCFKILNLFKGLLGMPLRWIISSYQLYLERVLVTFCILGLAVGLTSIFPSLQSLILSELEFPSQKDRPKLFLFDIQSEQFEPLKDSLTAWEVSLQEHAPMVRARLLSKNGQPISRDTLDASSQEASANQRFQNRGYNLSYRENLSTSEKILEGRWWEGSFNPEKSAYPQISIERGFASRLKISLFDTLNFDVQGVEVAGVVSSLRSVRWASFQPNFFVLFQPGVLEMAPKTFLGTLTQTTKNSYLLEGKIANSFPNISVLEVESVLKKITAVYQKMGNLVLYISLFGLFIGILILFQLIFSLIEDSKPNLNYLHIMGLSESKILNWTLLEYGALLAVSAFLGFLLSQISVWVLNYFFLELPWQFYNSGVYILLAGLVATILFFRIYLQKKLKRARHHFKEGLN